MTKNKFLIVTGLKGEHRLVAKPYLDTVAQYKGELSYDYMYLCMCIAITFGSIGPTQILAFVNDVMSMLGIKITGGENNELHRGV